MSSQKTALLSASNKDGLGTFAGELTKLGWNLLASAGTAKYLAERGTQAKDVAEIVGPPILGHRVVTLSRELHAALLATDSEADQAELVRLGVPRIDLVYVNLYPLQAEIANPDHTLKSVIEKTDIGGPTLLRSAAKGRRIALCRPTEFDMALDFIRGRYRGVIRDQVFVSAFTVIAEREIAAYCAASADFHQGMVIGDTDFTQTFPNFF